MPRNRTQASGSDKTVKAVVLVDHYAWQEPIENTAPVQYQRFEADPAAGSSSAKGVEIEVSEAEFERGATMTPPALAKAGSKEAKRFFGEPQTVDPKAGYADLSDEELATIVTQRNGNPDGMSRDELVGFVAGTPGNPSSNPAS